MSAGFSIRRAEAADAGELVELARTVGREPEGWLVTTNEWRPVSDERRYLKALKRYPDAAVYVAEAAGGALIGRLSLARDPHPGSAHVADLGLMVAKGHRRRGVGWALLEQAVAWARESGVEKLELHVFPHNEGAIRLYERFGFEQAGYRKRHYRRADGDYVDAILMEYPL